MLFVNQHVEFKKISISVIVLKHLAASTTLVRFHESHYNGPTEYPSIVSCALHLLFLLLLFIFFFLRQYVTPGRCF